MLLFFDTETTGLVDFGAPAEAEHQPDLVQLGAVLVDDARRVVATVGKIVKPQGWEIPAQAAAVHGISTELAQKVGWSREDALNDFSVLASMADGIVGHNVEFDLKIMRTAFHREQLGMEVFWGLKELGLTKRTQQNQ